MRLTTLTLIAGLTMPLPALSDTTELAHEYVNLPGVQQLFDDMFSPEALAAQFRLGVPPEIQLTDDKLSRIGDILSVEMNKLRPEMTNYMIASMADVFSEDELSALIAFYSSEHGASAMRKMQPYMADVMAQLVPRMGAMQQAVLPQIIELMQE